MTKAQHAAPLREIAKSRDNYYILTIINKHPIKKPGPKTRFFILGGTRDIIEPKTLHSRYDKGVLMQPRAFRIRSPRNPGVVAQAQRQGAAFIETVLGFQFPPHPAKLILNNFFS
jgi:hypothetical protein